MSVKVMSMVFDRYPEGAGEMLLALALADHAHDDGSKVFPYVDTLAGKTRQSIRTVQRQLQQMQARGWLQLVNAGDGGRGRAREYRISAAWLAGGECEAAEQAPIAAVNDAQSTRNPHNQKGDKVTPFIRPKKTAKGDIAVSPFTKDHATERVTNGAIKGDTAVSPAIEPQEPSLKPIPPQPPRGEAPPKPKAKRESAAPIALQTWLDACKAAGEKPIPATDPIFDYADRVGLPEHLLVLCWREFVRRRGGGTKRQADWRRTFRNCVEGNWYGLWFFGPDGRCDISSKGRQAAAFHDTASAVAA